MAPRARPAALAAVCLLLALTTSCGSDPGLPTGARSDDASTKLESWFQTRYASAPWFDAITDYQVQGRFASVFVMGGRSDIADDVCRALLGFVSAKESSLSVALVRSSAGVVVRRCRV